MQIPGKTRILNKGILFGLHLRVGPISGWSPETSLQGGILLMSDKCRSAFQAFESLYFLLFLEEKKKWDFNLGNAYKTSANSFVS